MKRGRPGVSGAFQPRAAGESMRSSVHVLAY